MATITHEQFGGDEEDMCEDSGPAYIYDYVRLSPRERFMKQSRLLSVRRGSLFHQGGFNTSTNENWYAANLTFCICTRVSRY